MSDECELFGTLMLESLLARQARIDHRIVRLSSLGIGVWLTIAAAIPLVLSRAIPAERQVASHATRAAAHPGVIDADVSSERLVRLTAPMAPKSE